MQVYFLVCYGTLFFSFRYIAHSYIIIFIKSPARKLLKLIPGISHLYHTLYLCFRPEDSVIISQWYNAFVI